ncbi:vWA domain-containing protein [Sorangium sp. So ce1078]|uniref:vWA domain-containing protein n=1 Tax=Sorangium sp. So ce1078 TaxID=3133329 RepID=UPI003F60D772
MRLPAITIALSMVAAFGAACGGSGDGEDLFPSGSGAGNGSGAANSSGDGSGGAGNGFGAGGDLNLGGSDDPGGPTGAGGSTGAGDACATHTAKAELQPVYLAVAFDVSGSMGANDRPSHSKELKWDPVVAATKQFFADPASAGLTASLTFFPGEERRRMCSARTYSTPDVEMTPLPSEAFAEAIDEVTPETDDDWRMGTPTAFVVEGTISFIEGQRQQDPGKYALVLVTDGYPQLCEGSDSIEAVVEHVEEALDDNIPTYVIGVANPPDDGPGNVDNLHDIAAAGGTGEAFLIETGNPDATATSFRAAIDQIRGAAVSCTVAIPPAPDGRTFDKQRVRVTYTSGDSEPKALAYDQECASDDAWRYDDPANPTQIELCESACSAVQSDPEASLGVDFTCDDVIEVPQ